MKKVTIRKDERLIRYPDALSYMEEFVERVVSGKEAGLVWILEHENVYTAGSSAKPESLLDYNKFPIYKVGRGGDYTYHGPGQIVVYFVLDLKRFFFPKEPDLKKYIYLLEEVIIRTLLSCGIISERKKDMIGVWIKDKGKMKKIAAIGVRVRKWVSYHGISINFDPDLSNFEGIIPCGIKDYGVTSIKECGTNIDKGVFIRALKENIGDVLGI